MVVGKGRKLEVIYDEESFDNVEVKISTIKEVSKFPDNVRLKSNIAVIVFNQKDLKEYIEVEGHGNVTNGDYRFILSANVGGKYIEVSDKCFMYIEKYLTSGLFIYDPTGGLIELPNKLIDSEGE